MKKLVLGAVVACVSLMYLAWAESETNAVSVRLWGTGASPYVRKVMTVLEEKNIPYQLEPILPTVLLQATEREIPLAFQQVSPLGKIPALEVEGFHVSDSAVISAYIEKKWPHTKNSLYPENPEDYANALWFERYADTVMTEVFHKIFVERVVFPRVLQKQPDEEKVSEYRKQIPGILQYLDKSASQSSGEYIVGKELTIGDVAIAHQFIGLQTAGIALDLKNYPALSKYLERVLSHPSIQKAVRKM